MMPGGRGRGYGRGGFGPRGPGRGFGPGFGRALIPMGPQVGPLPPGCIRVAAAVLTNSGMASPISPRFARAPYMAFVDLKEGKVMSLKILENPYVSMPRGAGIGTAQWLISNQVSAVLAVNVGPNLAFALEQAGVRVIPVQVATLELALKASGLLSRGLPYAGSICEWQGRNWKDVPQLKFPPLLERRWNRGRRGRRGPRHDPGLRRRI